MKIKSIWLEYEHWAPGEWNPNDDNSDVLVTLEDDTQWGATVFTYSNIETLRQKNAQTGECMAGAYFWATDLLLIDVLTRDRIEEVVQHLLDEDEFESIFTRFEEDEEFEGHDA